jgi:hypothetical protein
VTEYDESVPSAATIFLSELNQAERSQILQLSVLRWFDRSLFEHVLGQNAPIAFDALIHSPIMQSLSQSTFAILPGFRQEYIGTLGVENRRELKAISRVAASYFYLPLSEASIDTIGSFIDELYYLSIADPQLCEKRLTDFSNIALLSGWVEAASRAADTVMKMLTLLDSGDDDDDDDLILTASLIRTLAQALSKEVALSASEIAQLRKLVSAARNRRDLGAATANILEMAQEITRGPSGSLSERRVGKETTFSLGEDGVTSANENELVSVRRIRRGNRHLSIQELARLIWASSAYPAEVVRALALILVSYRDYASGVTEEFIPQNGQFSHKTAVDFDSLSIQSTGVAPSHFRLIPVYWLDRGHLPDGLEIRYYDDHTSVPILSRDETDAALVAAIQSMFPSAVHSRQMTGLEENASYFLLDTAVNGMGTPELTDRFRSLEGLLDELEAHDSDWRSSLRLIRPLIARLAISRPIIALIPAELNQSLKFTYTERVPSPPDPTGLRRLLFAPTRGGRDFPLTRVHDSYDHFSKIHARRGDYITSVDVEIREGLADNGVTSIWGQAYYHELDADADAIALAEGQVLFEEPERARVAISWADSGFPTWAHSTTLHVVFDQKPMGSFGLITAGALACTGLAWLVELARSTVTYGAVSGAASDLLTLILVIPAVLAIRGLSRLSRLAQSRIVIAVIAVLVTVVSSVSAFLYFASSSYRALRFSWLPNVWLEIALFSSLTCAAAAAEFLLSTRRYVMARSQRAYQVLRLSVRK